MNIFDELRQCFDAKFNKKDLEDHYINHTDGGNKTQLPKGMTKEEYARKGEQVSLKSIDPITKKNRKVRAYKRPDGKIIKFDGEWLVSYTGGKNGKLNTAFPATQSYFESNMRDRGEEIFWE